VRALGLEVVGRGPIVSFGPTAPRHIQDTPLTGTLDDGQTASMYIARAPVCEALISRKGPGKCELVAYCDISTGQEFRGKTLKVNPAELPEET